jgi:galactoside O-acetyltransferase
MGFLSSSQLLAMGFRSCGENVLISDKASIHGASAIAIGDSVRIDDFCILSAGAGGIFVGHHVHIACFSSLIGKESITLGDFANLSSRVSVYSSSDDYSGKYLTNPMVPDEFKNVDHRPVSIGRHVIIGCGSVVLPGVSIGEGCAVGALSLVKASCEPFGTYAGIPALRKDDRSRDLLMAEECFLEVIKSG